LNKLGAKYLPTDFSQIVKLSLKVRSKVFERLIEDATHLLCKENGKVGNVDILGRLARLNPVGRALMIGDLHGDLESLIDIFNESRFLSRLDQTDDDVVIFLGDYGDRGAYSAEIYYTILKLKLLFPKQVILIRGNHEGPDDLMVDPYDLPSQFQMRFGKGWTRTHSRIRKLFACMYNAVVVEKRYLIIHGGLSQKIGKIEDLAYAHLKHPRQDLLEDMLWSDPNEIVKETCASPRGAGKLFGENITREVLEKLVVKILIRGHEPCQEGFKIDHNGKVLTLFSRKGPPYFNAYGAYLDVDLSKKPENARQLIRYIHKF
jgi:protein phosphatase